MNERKYDFGKYKKERKKERKNIIEERKINKKEERERNRIKRQKKVKKKKEL